jgi:hypothetical protein
VLCEACPRSTILGGIEGSGGTLHKSLHQASRAALGTKVPWSRLDRQKRPPEEIDGPRLCRVEASRCRAYSMATLRRAQSPRLSVRHKKLRNLLVRQGTSSTDGGCHLGFAVGPGCGITLLVRPLLVTAT